MAEHIRRWRVLPDETVINLDSINYVESKAAGCKIHFKGGGEPLMVRGVTARNIVLPVEEFERFSSVKE